MAITNAEMADAWGDLLGLTPEKVTQLAALLDQWALGGARLATWSRLATDVNLFNNAATAMVFDWYGGNASGGPNGDGLYPLMNSEGEVEMVPSPAKIMAGVSGLDPKGTLTSEGELPATGAQGDLWIIDGDAYVWSTSAAAWVNMGPFQGPQGLSGTITDVTLTMGAPGSEPAVALGGTPEAREIGLTVPAAAAGPTPVISFGDVTSSESGGDGAISLAPESTPEAPVFDVLLPRGGLGNTGPAAWTPVLAGVVDGERRVQQIVDWVGGGGTKPAAGKFIGPAGLVDTAAEATNWRGAGGSGSGDVVGPATSTNNALAIWDGTTGGVLSNGPEIGVANAGDLLRRSDGDGRYRAAGDVPISGVTGLSGALGDKADLVGGKIPLAQIPASAITDTFVVTSQAAMLALTVERGDVAVRSDLSKSFILQAEPATTLANWKELLTPTVVVPVFATVAEVWAGSVTDKIIPPSVLNAAMVPQALAISAGTVSPDCHNGINFDLPSINANITIANIANKTGKGGRSGSITGKNDATAGRTVSLGTDWKKIGTTAFPTAANAMWKLVYNIDANGVNYSVMVLSA